MVRPANCSDLTGVDLRREMLHLPFSRSAVGCFQQHQLCRNWSYSFRWCLVMTWNSIMAWLSLSPVGDQLDFPFISFYSEPWYKEEETDPDFCQCQNLPVCFFSGCHKRKRTIFLFQKLQSGLHYHASYPIAFSGMTRNHLQFQDYFFYLQDVVDWLERHGTCYKYKCLHNLPRNQNLWLAVANNQIIALLILYNWLIGDSSE